MFTAAAIAGLLGVLSVTRRLATTGLARRHGMTAVAAVAFTIQAAGAVALPHLARSPGWAAGCVTAFGLGFGVATIARPAILAQRYGTHRYATIAATVNVPVILAEPAAPVAAAALGVGHFLPWAAAACLLALLCLAGGAQRVRSRSVKQVDARRVTSCLLSGLSITAAGGPGRHRGYRWCSTSRSRVCVEQWKTWELRKLLHLWSRRLPASRSNVPMPSASREC